MSDQLWTPHDGREVQSVCFGGEVIGWQGFDLRASLHVEYLGDRTEAWVLVHDPFGKEVARHNTRLVESVVWAYDAGGAS